MTAATAAAVRPAADLASGKGHHDENFPVASFLVAARYRGPILAYYRFARAADDIADHGSASADEKLAGLAAMRRGLEGEGDSVEALALHEVAVAHDIPLIHARELLDAFTQDVLVDRYADWDELIDYCRLSAMPVGRYVLDVHGEDHRCWPANDALCAALQIINHLQDCGKDYRTLNRVYIPTDMLAAHGASIEDLSAERSTPALRATIVAVAERTRGLLTESAGFASLIRDRRLAAEVAVIQKLAEDLTDRLLTRDPLADRVHHRKWEAAALALPAALGQLLRKRPR